MKGDLCKIIPANPGWIVDYEGCDGRFSEFAIIAWELSEVKSPDSGSWRVVPITVFGGLPKNVTEWTIRGPNVDCYLVRSKDFTLGSSQ